MTRPLIGYVRVSTATQGRSGPCIVRSRKRSHGLRRLKATSLCACLWRSRQAKAVMPWNVVRNSLPPWQKHAASAAQ